jgi:hypothetical protein
MSIVDLLFNKDAHLLVGVADDLDADGSLRAYIDARYTHRHVHVKPEAHEKVRRAWAGALGHTSITVDPESICDCPEEYRNDQR